MKTLAALLLLSLAACYQPIEKPYLLSENPEDPACSEILPEDAILSRSWLASDVPVLEVIRNPLCAPEDVAESVALWAEAGQELTVRFVDRLGPATDGVITVGVGDPGEGLIGNSSWSPLGTRLVSCAVTVVDCSPALLGHEIGHCLGFGHAPQKGHLMSDDDDSTYISPGERLQLEAR